MEEQFLHFIWQYQYFDGGQLLTIDKQNVTVFKPGTRNSDAGPDFEEAKIKIGDIEWSGHVEIHVKSSDWDAHKHSEDRKYDSTILHVVWENDRQIMRSDGTKIPTIALKGLIEPALYDRFKNLVRSPWTIPCQPELNKVNNLTRLSQLDKSLAERLIEKSQAVSKVVEETKGNWEEATYKLMARNFGFKVNGDQFEQLANVTPINIAQKCADNLESLEALFFGQSGLIPQKTKESYSQKLADEYNFISHKHGLIAIKSPHQWKFMRMRPANFPTVRIAQFAGLIHQVRHLFSWILETENVAALHKVLKVRQSAYWQQHYRFGVKAARAVPALGQQSIQNVIINTVVPVLAAYSKAIGDDRYIIRAEKLLQELPAEKNRITKVFSGTNWNASNAFDSQALIQLHNNYCTKKRCLSCNIGVSLMRS
ncbi:MAG: DUF2851 family protein [Cyclobacteriaceae bacterium]